MNICYLKEEALTILSVRFWRILKCNSMRKRKLLLGKLEPKREHSGTGKRNLQSSVKRHQLNLTACLWFTRLIFRLVHLTETRILKISTKFDKFGLYFGIVTYAKLEDLPTFTLKAHFGIFSVSLEQLHLNQTTLSSEQIGDLAKFQEFLSSFGFDIHNKIFEHDPESAILIAPLNVGTSIEINWKLIEQTLKVENDRANLFKPPSEQSRLKMEFEQMNYLNKLLVPWYKKDQELYCTLSVTNLNARCAFENDPKSKYKTFEHYFDEKYDVKIFHHEFPLIRYKAL